VVFFGRPFQRFPAISIFLVLFFALRGILMNSFVILSLSLLTEQQNEAMSCVSASNKEIGSGKMKKTNFFLLSTGNLACHPSPQGLTSRHH
jgi:hypothetical protein